MFFRIRKSVLINTKHRLSEVSSVKAAKQIFFETQIIHDSEVLKATKVSILI